MNRINMFYITFQPCVYILREEKLERGRKGEKKREKSNEAKRDEIKKTE